VKVLFLTHSFPRFVGDAPGSFLLRLAVALRERDVDVHVVAPSAEGLAPRETLNGITVERFRYAPRQMETLAYTGTMAQEVSGSFAGKIALAGFLASEMNASLWARKKFDADLIHAHWWFPSGVIAAAMSRLTQRPLITTLHGTDVRMARAVQSSRVVFRSVLRTSKAVTTVSSWLASEVRDLAPGIEPVIAPMPAATERFAPGSSRESNRFLFAGRLNQQKGLAHLLRAFAVMKELAMLDVVGEGEDGANLKLLASQLGVSDRVVWHGQLSQDRLLHMYQKATAVVVPSVDEGLGLVAVEALLCESPVIAFKSGGLTDIIDHEKTGLLVPPGDTAALAGAMDRILLEHDLASLLASAGRQHALESFSPQSAAERYIAIYKEAIGKRAA
jgi:glycosyltransferase involved in cell wall biosynthesis